MTISEIIKDLQHILEIEGDLPVIIEEDYYFQRTVVDCHVVKIINNPEYVLLLT